MHEFTFSVTILIWSGNSIEWIITFLGTRELCACFLKTQDDFFLGVTQGIWYSSINAQVSIRYATNSSSSQESLRESSRWVWSELREWNSLTLIAIRMSGRY